MRAFPWWFKPEYICLIQFVFIPLMVFFSPSEFTTNFNVPRCIDESRLHYFLLPALMFLIGQYVAGHMERANYRNEIQFSNITSLKTPFYICVSIALLSYVVLFGIAMKNGLSIGIMLSRLSSSGDLTSAEFKREIFGRIPGVTSFAQVSMVVMALGTILHLHGLRAAKYWMAIVMAFTCFRAMFLSERLALIDAVIPIVLVWIAYQWEDLRSRQATRLTLSLGPLAGLVCIVGLFAAGEYYRSWQYYKNSSSGFVTFILERFMGYWTTSLSNAMLYRDTTGVLPLPYYTLSSVWNNPIVAISPFKYFNWTNLSPFEDYMDMLVNFANPEFNNCCGIIMPFMDYGYLGGLAWWCAMGAVFEKSFRGFCRADLAYIMIYPVMYASFLDVARLYSIFGERYFPPLLIAVIVAQSCGNSFRSTE
jgi:oligosaccharide repeat unit polymerase